MKGNELKRFFAMVTAVVMLTTPVLGVAEEAIEAPSAVVEEGNLLDVLEPSVSEMDEFTLGGDEEAAPAKEAPAPVAGDETDEVSEDGDFVISEVFSAEKAADDDEYTPRVLKVTAKNAKTYSSTLYIEDVINVKLAVKGASATSWTTSDDDVVEVDGDDEACEITAVGAGTAKVQAKLDNGKAVTINFTVYDPYIPVGLKFESDDVTYTKVGEELDLADSLLFNPGYATDADLTWSSSNSSVVSVDKETGVATPKAPGKAKVTVSLKDRKNRTKKATIKIQVVANKVTKMFDKPSQQSIINLCKGGWTFVPYSMELKTNGTLACKFFVLNGSDQDLTKLNNVSLYLTDGKNTFAKQSFGSGKVSCQKNGHYKSFLLTFKKANVNQDVFLPDLDEILIGVENPQNLVATAGEKNLVFFPVTDVHIADGYTPVIDDKVLVESITLSEAKEMKVGDTQTITATVTPDNATNPALNWASSDTKVATVDAKGVVTAVAEGTATITASAADESKKEASVTVTVAKPVIGFDISLDKTSLPLKETETATLTATTNPPAATVTWKSSDETVATVDAGKVTAVKAGTATITASITVDGATKEATCAVTVEAAPVLEVEVSLDKTSLPLKENETATLTATHKPEDAPVIWKSSDEKIVTVDEVGKVTAVKAGKATVSASVTVGETTKTAECEVEVTAAETDNVTLDKTSVELVLEEDYTYLLKATVKDGKAVTWTTTDDDIVDVTDKGLLVGKKVGTANVYATVGTESAKCVVTVVNPDAKSFDLDEKDQKLAMGKSLKVKPVNVKPTAYNPKSIIWSSSDSSVATVAADEKGVATVKAVKAGTATITAATEDNKFKQTIKITVPEEVVVAKTIVLSTNAMTIEAGTTEVLAVVDILAEDTSKEVTNKNVRYSTNRPDIVTVDSTDGRVYPNKVGEATIFVKSADENSDAMAKCTVTVTKAKVEVPVKVFIWQEGKDTKGVPYSYETTINAKTPLNLTRNVILVDENNKKSTNQAVTWTSSNQAIATIDENGVVTGKAVGEVVITAKSQENPSVSGTQTITIGAEEFDVTSVSLAKGKNDPDVLDLGDETKTTMTLTATLEPSNAKNKDKLHWETSNKAVATVSDTDNVDKVTVTAAGKVGKAKITVYATEGKDFAKATDAEKKAMKQASFEVEVKKIVHVESITVNPFELRLDVGKTEILSAEVVGKDGATPDEMGIVWSSLKPEIATVESGLVTGVKKGTTTIVATSKENDKIFTKCEVTVDQPVTSLTLDQSGTVDLEKDGKLTVKATVKPDDATNKTVKFESDKPDIASVDDKGVVTAKAIGKAKITATAGKKTASFTINVVRAPIAKITNVKAALEDSTRNIVVTWDKEKTEYADHYTVFVKQGDTLIRKEQVTGLSCTIDAKYLTSGQEYQITVQGTHGKDASHPTESKPGVFDDYKEGPVSDAEKINY